MRSSSASSATGLPAAMSSTAWALNSAVYCFLCLVVFMDGVCRIPVQKSSSPHGAFADDMANTESRIQIDCKKVLENGG